MQLCRLNLSAVHVKLDFDSENISGLFVSVCLNQMRYVSIHGKHGKFLLIKWVDCVTDDLSVI